MQDFYHFDQPVVRDEAYMKWRREDPVLMGLMNVQRMAIERDIADTQHWIEFWSAQGGSVERDRRHLQYLLDYKAWYDEQIGQPS